jgi:DNA-binding NtrC family response regulator
MAKVCLIGIDEVSALKIGRVLSIDGHQVTETLTNGETVPLHRIDLIFAGGESHQYLKLLTDVRTVRSDIPFVVMAKDATTPCWLDAIEAGVTDYYALPVEPRHLQWTMESIALDRQQRASGSASAARA